MKYSAVIFDLDGTLINSIEDLADSANAALKKYKFDTHPIEEYKKFVGNGLRQLIKVATPQNLDDDTIYIIWKECLNIYKNNYLNKTCLYDSILNMLQELKKLGIKMAVCTNKPDKIANEIVHKLIGSQYISVTYGERDGIPRKPDPASLIEAAKFLAVEPEKVIYVGDSGVDMICGNRAGMYSVGVLWGFREKEELVESGAQILLSNPMELIDFVKKVNCYSDKH